MIDASELPSDVRVALLTTDVSHHLHAAMGAGHDATAAHVRHTQLADPVDPALEDADGSMVVVELVAIQVSVLNEKNVQKVPHHTLRVGSRHCFSVPPCQIAKRLTMPKLPVPFPTRLRSTPQKAAGAPEKPLFPLLS